MTPDEQLHILRGTRAQHDPSTGLNISLDFNASPNGGARGTEVIIPDDASPELRAAAEAFNQSVAEFAAANGIAEYPVRGVRTRSENKRGVPNTVHVEPFFSDDIEMQTLIKENPAAFAQIYRNAFGSIPGRLIAPHGVGEDRGSVSTIFGDETTFGELMVASLLGEDGPEIIPGVLPPPNPETQNQGSRGVPPTPEEEEPTESWLTRPVEATGNETIDGLLTDAKSAGLGAVKDMAISALMGGNSAPPPPPPRLPAPPSPMQQVPNKPVMFKIKRKKENNNG